MATIFNKQPVFTAGIETKALTLDPKIPTDLSPIDNYDAVYTDGSTFGSLVTKVTVTATALNGETVTSKVIYLGVYDPNNTQYTLYKSALMTGLTLGATDLPPQVVFTFETADAQGLALKPGSVLTLSASTNNATTSQAGDFVAVVVEAATYDISA